MGHSRCRTTILADFFLATTEVTACASRNRNFVPGLSTDVPAVCLYRACCPVVTGKAGWTASVFTATLRPSTEIHVNSRVSGLDLRGLAGEVRIFPNAFVPALNRTVVLTATFSLIFTAKILPTGSREEIEVSVLTLRIVPAGILVAFKDEATNQAQHVAINTIVLCRIQGRCAYEEVLKADY